MSIFSKINSCFLALAVVFATFGQMHISSGNASIFPETQESNIPAYSGITSQNLWGLIDFERSSTLINFYAEADSEEDSKNSIEAEKARESSLTKLSVLYLAIAKNIDVHPSVGEILYPFHFYF
jgi:hypothetical protein